MLPRTEAPPTVSRRLFYRGMALAVLVIAVVGFFRTYYLRPLIQPTVYANGYPVRPSIAPLVHVHGVIFTTWIALFLVQTALIAANRRTWHKQLGVAGGVIGALVFGVGVAVVLRGAREGWNPGGPYQDSLAFMIAGLFDLSVFGVCIAAGLYYRRRPDIHKRLMLLGTAGGLMWAAITRIPYVATQFGLCVALLFGLVLASALHDWWTEKKVHPVSLWGGLTIVALFLVRPMLGSTTAWHGIAEWLVAHSLQL